jgi:hypothetical protein
MPQGPRFGVLPATHTTWLRYASRDLDPPMPAPPPAASGPGADASYELPLPSDPACAWLDGAELPKLTRRVLQDASGITIPGSDFVLKVILAYVVALVPLNWLTCRFLLRRRELAWIVTPLLALGFAIVVERGAAYDLGFDSACDEVDVLELQGDHPRGHLTRFAALYSTGRHAFTIAYPNDPTALALPLNMMNNLAGGETLQSSWQSYPEPALTDFPVQPRALAMFRAEQMVNLPGSVTLVDTAGERRVVNGTDLELRDAVAVDVGGRVQYRLGTIPPGGSAALGQALPLHEPPRRASDEEADEPEPESLAAAPDKDRWIDPEPFLERLRNYDWRRPEDRREWRLVAWNPQPHPGQQLRPSVDRHRGLRLVLAHLDYGPTPYFDLNRGEEAIAPYLTPAAPKATDPAGTTPGAPARRETETERP